MWAKQVSSELECDGPPGCPGYHCGLSKIVFVVFVQVIVSIPEPVPENVIASVFTLW